MDTVKAAIIARTSNKKNYVHIQRAVRRVATIEFRALKFGQS